MTKSVFLASGLALVSVAASMAQTPIPLNTTPSRIVGHPPEQLQPMTTAPNLVEGREVWQPRGLAIDASVSPARLYVADSGNNRILGWSNAVGFRNGQPADLVIGQQGGAQDFMHTTTGGPGTLFSAGLSTPTGLAVDSNGNLYVADTGDNRILRFPKPFEHIGDERPDMHIGQPRYDTKAANFTGVVGDQGLNLTGSPWPTNITLDAPQENLWVVDGGNRRVLRFANSDLAAAINSDVAPHANLVIGQQDFTTVQAIVTSATKTTANAFTYPNGIAFDSAGRLYVSDAASDSSVARVLVFTAPFSAGQSAVRMMGVIPGTETAGDQFDKTRMASPTGMFFVPSLSKMGVLDALSNRILLFDTMDKWKDQATEFSPQATASLGQPDYHNRNANGAKDMSALVWSGVQLPSAAPPTSLSFWAPRAAVFFNNELYVADTGNCRVAVLPVAGGTFGPATRVLGQDNFAMSGSNLVEGREFAFLSAAQNGSSSGAVFEGAAVAIDETSDTPHLYVADTFNHRVLGFRDFRKAQAGSKADIVVGQPDLNSNLCNITGNPDAHSATSLCVPTGLVVDSHGDLYVADSGNGRVLRFPAPFARPAQLPAADLVLGKRTFTEGLGQPGQAGMSAPYGLAISGADGLFVSDLAYNRVLYFAFTGNNSFAAGTDNGRAATRVFGQPSFTTIDSGNSDTAMNSPRHMGVDNLGRLYVADTGNNRVLIFDNVKSSPDAAGAHAIFSLPSNQPRGIFVSQLTDEFWVAEGGTNAVKRYPKYGTLILNPASNYQVAAGSLALAVTQDQFGDMIVADASSRVQFYFPGVNGYNGGHLLPSRMNLAPGLLTSLCSPGSACDPATRTSLFGPNTVYVGDSATPFPLPTTLGDVQVLFGPTGGDLKPVPLYYVSPSQINFVVPMNAPQSGTVDIQIWQPSTGRIFAAGTAPMGTVAPAVLMQNFSGKLRQAAVVNEDGTVNSQTNPAKRGSYVSLYATGQGFIPNAPPDGASPGNVYPTPQAPRINLNGAYLDDMIKNPEDKPKDQWLYYSGLSPSYPGLWQINFYIPSGVPASTQVPLIITAGGVPSTDGSIVTTIAVK